MLRFRKFHRTELRMKIIESGKDIYDKKYSAEVPTDITLFNKIKDLDFGEYSLVNFPSEKTFHRDGRGTTKPVQKIVDDITSRQDKKYIFFCQHIYVHRINWYNNIVFTPHLWEGCPVNTKSVPHYSLNVKDLNEHNQDILFSFVGASHTHPIRKKLISDFDNCINTGGWMKKDKLDLFFNLMGRCKFSLCPRGTGIGTIRIFESMAMGRIPVIISNGFKPPLDWMLDWNEFSVKIPEEKYSEIPNILSKYTEEQIIAMSKKTKEVWEEYFSPDNMHKVITLEMKELLNHV